MPLADVLVAAGDVVSGILTAKAAAQAACATSDAAVQARASAEKVRPAVPWLQEDWYLQSSRDPDLALCRLQSRQHVLD